MEFIGEEDARFIEHEGQALPVTEDQLQALEGLTPAQIRAHFDRQIREGLNADQERILDDWLAQDDFPWGDFPGAGPAQDHQVRRS